MVRTGVSSKFRPDIEGLRGIAVLLVVAYHVGIPGIGGGFIGVDVFFVLSGYLITGLLASEIENTSRLHFAAFYARRARRLLPASALVVTTTLVLSALILAPSELDFAGRAARATAVYLSNVFFALNKEDYFAPDLAMNPLLHTWSLAVEEQFYLFWPLFIMLGLRVLRSRKALVLVLGGITVLSFAACVWWTGRDQPFAFYNLPARAWEFGIAGLATFLPKTRLKIPPAIWSAVQLAGLAGIGVSAYVISVFTPFPGWTALAPVLATAAILVSATYRPDGVAMTLLGSSILQTLGRLSYSWYLWHWPFLIFANALDPNISVAGNAVAAALALGVSALAYRFVESPIRFHPSLIGRPILTLSLAAGLTLWSLGAADYSRRVAQTLADEPANRIYGIAFRDEDSLPRERCVTDRPYADVKTCVFGNAASPINVVLFGDSHAMVLFDPLKALAETHGFKLTTVVKTGCPAVDFDPHLEALFDEHCAEWRAKAIAEIAAMHSSLVVLSDSSGYPLASEEPVLAKRLLQRWHDATRRTLEQMTQAGLRVALVRDNPHFPFGVPACLGRTARQFWRSADPCAMDRDVVLPPQLFEVEQSAVSGVKNAHLIDLTDQYCTRDTCAVMKNGLVMYRDGNHMTRHFALSMAPALGTALLSLVPELADPTVPK